MDLAPLLDRLAAFPAVLDTLLRGLPPADLDWRPPEGGWTLLEIAAHLAEEETTDFRTRLASTLEDPGRPWPPIDPEGHVASLAAEPPRPAAVLRLLGERRAATVAWLRGLPDPDWDLAHRHPRGFDLDAGSLLASLAAHDALHLRQVAHRLHQLAARDAPGRDLRYAGPW